MAAVKERKIAVGDLIDLTSRDDGIPYRTKVEDVRGGRVYSAGVPSSGVAAMVIHVDDELYLTFYRETGRYTVRIRVVGFERKGDVRYLLFTQLSMPEKDQRRMYFRLPVSLNVIMCEYLDELFDNVEEDLPVLEEIDEAHIVVLETVGSKDLSITGISVLSKNDYEMGKKLVLRLEFEDEKSKEKDKDKEKNKEKPFIIYAEIMRKEFDYKTNSNRLGMHFFGQTHIMSEFLAKYVLKEQTVQLRQRRLIEGH